MFYSIRMNVYACIPLNIFTLMLGQIKMQSVVLLYKHRKIMAIEAEETETAKEVRSFLCIPFTLAPLNILCTTLHPNTVVCFIWVLV